MCKIPCDEIDVIDMLKRISTNISGKINLNQIYILIKYR